MLRERNDADAFRVIEVEEDDAYFQHFLDVERSEIARFNPGFTGVTESASRFAYLVVHGHETVGVVVVRDAADGVGQVELDYVTARYRDFTPGEFVWRHSGLFTGHGWRTIRTPGRHGGRLLRAARASAATARPGPSTSPASPVPGAGQPGAGRG